MSSEPTIDEFRSDYASALLSSVSYGAYIVIATLSFYLLQKRGKTYQGRRVTLLYTAGMSLLTTVWYCTGARTSAYEFVDSAFEDQLNITCAPALIITKVAAMLQILASDGALLYRAYVLWQGNMRVIVPLLLVYMVSMGFGILSELFCVNEVLYQASTLLHVVAFISTVVLNLLTTLAIAGRILLVQRRMAASNVVHSGVEGRIASVAAVLIESAALYAIVGIALVPAFLRGTDAAGPLGTLLQSLAFLSPALIVFRVAIGVSFDNDLSNMQNEPLYGAPRGEQMSTLVFMHADTLGEKPSPVDQLRRFADPGII